MQNLSQLSFFCGWKPHQIWLSIFGIFTDKDYAENVITIHFFDKLSFFIDFTDFLKDKKFGFVKE